MEFLKYVAPIGRAWPELPATGKEERIPYIAGLPIANFSPGHYEFRITVKQGASIGDERTTFSIHP